MKTRESVGVIVGRFQPITNAQIESLFVPAVKENDLVVVLLGSSHTSRDFKNPFTAEARSEMIRDSLAARIGKEERSVIFAPIRDFWSDKTTGNDRFLIAAQNGVTEAVKRFFGNNAKLSDFFISIYGTDSGQEKDRYLTRFPSWNSRIMRDSALSNQDDFAILRSIYEDTKDWVPRVPGVAARFCAKFFDSNKGKEFVTAYQMMKRYWSKYEKLEKAAGHNLQFMTVDNVVLYNGNILLVRRRSHPGKGLWALPGGFLEANETTFDGAKRELDEETSVFVRNEWMTRNQYFDHPGRSLRGRTLTFAFRWDIPSKIRISRIGPSKGFEREVTRVAWFSLSEVLSDMKHLLFEDHLEIIEAMTS